MSNLNDHAVRGHALLSASSSSRWLQCPPSAAAAAAYSKQDTPYTLEGTRAHEIAEAFAAGKVIPVSELDWCTPEMIRCAGDYADYIKEQIKSDSAMILLEQRVDFSPWVPDGFGTADCIIIQDGIMDVIDYKYGEGVRVSADGNTQEMCYGLGAVNDYGFVYDIHTVRLHIFQPRVDNISVHELTAEELLAWGESIKPIAQQAASGKGKYSAGAHCKFCPHAGKCRELAKACTQVVGVNGEKLKISTLTEWEVADILKLEPMITEWLKKIKAQAVTDMLNGKPIPGYKVVAGRTTRSWADETEVIQILGAAGHPKDTITTEPELLSVAQMEKAISKKEVAKLLSGQILTTPGAPTVAPETDKRPAYDRLAEAKKDFE